MFRNTTYLTRSAKLNFKYLTKTSFSKNVAETLLLFLKRSNLSRHIGHWVVHRKIKAEFYLISIFLFTEYTSHDFYKHLRWGVLQQQNRLLFHNGGRYHIKTSPLICSANQWTRLYMITASVMKELTIVTKLSTIDVCECLLNLCSLHAFISFLYYNMVWLLRGT